MPWQPDDAPKHNRKAKTAAQKHLWARVANERLDATGNDALAIREANSALDRSIEGSKTKYKRL